MGEKATLPGAWLVPDAFPPLARGEVHVWLLPLDLEPAAAARVHSWLSGAERLRADRLRVPDARARFLAARGLLRGLLAGYLNCSPSDITFTIEAGGKPALPARPEYGDLRFNFSHSGKLALGAVSWGRDVGVDVERIRPGPWENGVAERFFAPEETTALHALPTRERRAAFFRVWTRKEACLKSWGRGLTLPLNSFVVPLTIPEPPAVVRISAGQCQLWPLPPIPGHEAALAVNGRARQLRCWRWPPSGR